MTCLTAACLAALFHILPDMAFSDHCLALRVSLTVSQDLKVNLFGLQQDSVVTVMVRIMMWESPGDSHAVTIQWVCMVKDPLATILLVHTVTSKYTFAINNDRYLITWP